MVDARRERPIRKMVSFSEAEWERVEARMTVANDRSFDSFARRACLESEVKVVRRAFDPQELRAELARVGNNVNQIARLANIEQESTSEQVRAVKGLLREIQSVILEEFRRIE